MSPLLAESERFEHHALHGIQHFNVGLVAAGSRHGVHHLTHHIHVWHFHVSAGIRERVTRLIHQPVRRLALYHIRHLHAARRRAWRSIDLKNRDLEILVNEFPEVDDVAAKAWYRGSTATYLDRFADMKADLDPTRLEQEMVLLAQKSDVAEELDRLDGHLRNARQNLSEGGNVGKKLDFLMQEFNREANTLGSKSASLTQTQASLELKLIIEQMREQVQNLE